MTEQKTWMDLRAMCDENFKHGGPPRELLSSVLDICVGSWQEMGLDLKPIWNGHQHHLPSLGGCPTASRNRPPAAGTWTHVVHISYTCRGADGFLFFGPQVGRHTSDQFCMQKLTDCPKYKSEVSDGGCHSLIKD